MSQLLCLVFRFPYKNKLKHRIPSETKFNTTQEDISIK